MKIVFLFLFAIALASALPLSPPPPTPPHGGGLVIKIVKSDFHQEPAGPYAFNFETENGIARDEVGELKSVKDEEGHEEQVIVSKGSYSYPGEDGKVLTLTFTADENGFHPEADYIPK